MKQGALSSKCCKSLSQQEISSLSKIRDAYSEKPIFSISVEQTLQFIDRAYESMGRTYRNRINTETINFGRYTGELDGVFLMIANALRIYDYATHFPSTPAEASQIHRGHKKNISRARKKVEESFADLANIIERLIPSAFTKQSNEKLRSSLGALDEIRCLLAEHLDVIDFDRRSESVAESFVTGVCANLVWNANIKPTKAMTDSHKKTPLLRFLEVFYPDEASAILAKLHDRERGLPQHKRIGATFIPPVQ
ncbi:hypothetical protein [Pseudomonas canadensis]|uniref:hypothetical protein n=1 Tax=Pseudomonas canadensis TaxID=915099 RepID=UPI003BA3515D